MANRYEYPEISFTDTNAESLTNNLIKSYEMFTGRTLYPADPTRLFILWIADIIIQTRIQIDEKAKQNIPRFAKEENLDIILNEAKYLNNLVQELLDLSKLQSKSQQLTKEKFDLIEEVAGLIKRLENLYPNREVEYHGPKSLLIKEDKSQINQVLYNLINNALNYSEDKVGISIDVMNNKARISVWDKGPGLAEEELSKIWTRYYRSDNDHKRMVHGSGIGLSIVKNIFENNSINFGVKNRESQGLEILV
mgnify:CR=1 FL=1